MVYCRLCRRSTEHVDEGQRTVTPDGVTRVVWLTCIECRAENPR